MRFANILYHVQLQGITLQVLKFNPNRSHSAKKLTTAIRQAQKIPDSSSNADLGYYNERMLQYAHFIHSVNMLERLLLYKKGRDLFPVKIPGRDGVWMVHGHYDRSYSIDVLV